MDTLSSPLVPRVVTPKLYVAPSPIHGQGVFSGIRFKKGERILQIDDTRVVTTESPLCPDLGEEEIFCSNLGAGKVVELQPPECFINHSCEPNAYIKTLGGFRYLLALRDIQGCEELTYHYSINGCGDGEWPCHCGSESCLGQVPVSFFRLPRERQLHYLPLLDDWFVAEHYDEITTITVSETD